jgi:hypothetical protein
LVIAEPKAEPKGAGGGNTELVFMIRHNWDEREFLRLQEGNLFLKQKERSFSFLRFWTETLNPNFFPGVSPCLLFFFSCFYPLPWVY